MDRRLIVSVFLALLSAASVVACSDDTAGRQGLDEQRRTELIGVDGGTLRSADELLFVEVPARAVVASTLFTVEPAPDAPTGAVSTAYEISPSGRVFDRPLRLVFDARRLDTGAPLDALRVAVAEEGRWVRQPRPRLDPAAGTLAIETLHLSTWAVVVATCQSDAECLTGESCVDGTCAVNTCSSDADCPDGACADALCGPVPPCEADTECDAGNSCVAGRCQTAPGCQGAADCADGEICQAGLCQLATADCLADEDCTAGQVCNAGSCVNDAPACTTTADCAPGQVCGPSGDCLCDGNTVMCGASCVDTTTDANHCGDCDVACATGEVCVAAVCTPPTSADCQGDDDCPAGRACDVATGTCVGMTCDSDAVCADGEVCVNGVCQVSTTMCTAGELDCAGVCVDTMSDPMHCGGCDQACANGESCLDAACLSAGCAEVADCPAGQTCDAGVCTPTCTADSDCASGEVCSTDGLCRAASAACQDDADCGNGEVCNAGTCGCPAGTMMCDGTCIDPDTDDNHCGVCHNACSALHSCNGGTCVLGG